MLAKSDRGRAEPLGVSTGQRKIVKMGCLCAACICALCLGPATSDNVQDIPLLKAYQLDSEAQHLAFNPSDSHHLLVSTSGKVFVMDVLSGQEIYVLNQGSGGRKFTRGWIYAPSGDLVAACGGPGVLLCAGRTGEWVWVLLPSDEYVQNARWQFWQLAFSPNGQLLAAADSGWGSGFHVWDVHQRTFLCAVESQFWFVNSVAFSSDGKTLAAGTWGDGGIHLWDTTTWAYVRPLYITSERNAYKGETNRRWEHLVFSPDGKYLAASGSDGSLLLLDLASGYPRWLVQQLGQTVTAPVFSDDGRFLVAATSSDVVLLWRTDSGSLERTIHVPGEQVSAVALSRGSVLLAVGTLQGRIHVYAFRDREFPTLSPSVLASQTYVDIDKDGTLETIELYLSRGSYYEDRRGWCGEGWKWEGAFNIRVRRGAEVLSVQSLEDVLGWSTAFFRAPQFELLVDDFNDDGQVDFALGQYAGCNGSDIRLLTVEPSGRVRSLSAREFYVGSLENCRPNPICRREGAIGFNYYNNGHAYGYLTDWYRWDGTDFVFIGTTIQFCEP